MLLLADGTQIQVAELAALERLLGRLGTGPGWAAITPDAPPR